MLLCLIDWECMSKKQFIESKIREACPELMELKRGCHVLLGESEAVFIGNKVEPPYPYSFYHIDDNEINSTNYIDKIIGHPIHLEHVMRVIKRDMDRFDAEYWHYSRELLLRYDLTKTFEQNMENENLVDFLAGVLGCDVKSYTKPIE